MGGAAERTRPSGGRPTASRVRGAGGGAGNGGGGGGGGDGGGGGGGGGGGDGGGGGGGGDGGVDGDGDGGGGGRPAATARQIHGASSGRASEAQHARPGGRRCTGPARPSH